MDEEKHRKSMKPVLKALKLTMEKFYIWYITMDGTSGKQEMSFLFEISFVDSKRSVYSFDELNQTVYMYL